MHSLSSPVVYTLFCLFVFLTDGKKEDQCGEVQCCDKGKSTTLISLLITAGKRQMHTKHTSIQSIASTKPDKKTRKAYCEVHPMKSMARMDTFLWVIAFLLSFDTMGEALDHSALFLFFILCSLLGLVLGLAPLLKTTVRLHPLLQSNLANTNPTPPAKPTKLQQPPYFSLIDR